MENITVDLYADFNSNILTSDGQGLLRQCTASRGELRPTFRDTLVHGVHMGFTVHTTKYTVTRGINRVIVLLCISNKRSVELLGISYEISLNIGFPLLNTLH